MSTSHDICCENHDSAHVNGCVRPRNEDGRTHSGQCNTAHTAKETPMTIPITTEGFEQLAPPLREVALTAYLDDAAEWLATDADAAEVGDLIEAANEIAAAVRVAKTLAMSKKTQIDARHTLRRAKAARRAADAPRLDVDRIRRLAAEDDSLPPISVAQAQATVRLMAAGAR